MIIEMIGVFRPRFCTCKAILGPGTIWANKMNFGIKNAPGAGSIDQPLDQQSSTLPLYHGRPDNGYREEVG